MKNRFPPSRRCQEKNARLSIKLLCIFSYLTCNTLMSRRGVANRLCCHAIAPKSLRKPDPSYPAKAGLDGISGITGKTSLFYFQRNIAKPIRFLGDSLKCLRDFSEDAGSDAGYQLDKVQRGEQPDDWKPMPSIGKGVEEIGFLRRICGLASDVVLANILF